MDPVAIDQAVASHLPDEFLTAAVRSVFLAREETHNQLKGEFAETERTNVAPYYVRGKVEGILRGAVARIKSMTADVVQASGWNHTEVKSGPFTLTAHAVDYPCGMVNDVKYRRSLAEKQTSLIDPGTVMPDARLYALLLHSPFRGQNSEEERQYDYLPGSVYLAFPEAARRSYAHQINLFEKFPKLIDSLLPKEWDGAARAVYRWQARQKAA